MPYLVTFSICLIFVIGGVFSICGLFAIFNYSFRKDFEVGLISWLRNVNIRDKEIQRRLKEWLYLRHFHLWCLVDAVKLYLIILLAIIITLHLQYLIQFL